MSKVHRVCQACHKQEKKMFRCAQCQVTYYCSAECQKNHWRAHKKECNVLKDAEAYLRKEVSNDKVDTLLQLYCFYFCNKNKCNCIDVECNKTEEMMTFDIYFDTCSLLPEYVGKDVYIINFLVPFDKENFVKAPVCYSWSGSKEAMSILSESGMAGKLIARILPYPGIQLRYHYATDTCDGAYL